jgi:hypothetical protein
LPADLKPLAISAKIYFTDGEAQKNQLSERSIPDAQSGLNARETSASWTASADVWLSRDGDASAFCLD